jgi:hypothetical protein
VNRKTSAGGSANRDLSHGAADFTDLPALDFPFEIEEGRDLRLTRTAPISGVAGAEDAPGWPQYLSVQRQSGVTENIADSHNTIDFAREYLQRGWRFVGIAAGRKNPIGRGWPDLELGAEDLPKYFGGRQNLGVLLGPKSGNLVDIDLDAPEAITIADLYLPATDAVFGRPSKPRSHRLYVAVDAEFVVFADPLTGDTLLELRTSGRQSRAHQTLLPPSVTDGERRQWSGADGFAPRVINAAHLRQAAGWLAVGCLVSRHLGETPARRPRRDMHRLLWEVDHQLGRVAYGWLGLPAPDQLARQARKSHAGPRSRFGNGEPDLHELAAAIPNIGYGWEEWNKIGLAFFAASGGSEEGRRAFDAFSGKSPKYSPAAVNERWTNFGRWPPSNTGIGKLLALAWEARR